MLSWGQRVTCRGQGRGEGWETGVQRMRHHRKKHSAGGASPLPCSSITHKTPRSNFFPFLSSSFFPLLLLFFKDLFIYLFIYLLCIQCSVCMYACRPEEGTRSHYRQQWATMWLLGLNSGPLEGQSVLLTSEPSQGLTMWLWLVSELAT